MTYEEAIAMLGSVFPTHRQVIAGYTPDIRDAISLATKALEKQIADRWISVSERLPEKSDIYLATFVENERNYVERFYYSTFGGWMMPVNWQDEGRVDKIIAWKPLPKPYTEADTE